MVEYRKEVDELLNTYAEYKKLIKVEEELSLKCAKQKIAGVVDAELVSEYETAKRKLQSLSDSITFANPIVWIMYKFEAYKNESQPIRTMSDFRIHCSKDGYICTKRFLFVNEQLIMRDQKSLAVVSYYDDNMYLDQLLEDSSLQNLVKDPDFINLWQYHEYNTIEGRVAKWESYSVAE